MKKLTLLFLLLPLASASAESLLPQNWDAKQAGDRVLDDLIQVTAPQVKGAHDAEMAITNAHAYIVAEVNDDRTGEAAGWPSIYSAMSIVDLNTMTLQKVIPVARGEQVFENDDRRVQGRYDLYRHCAASVARPLPTQDTHEPRTPCQDCGAELFRPLA